MFLKLPYRDLKPHLFCLYSPVHLTTSPKVMYQQSPSPLLQNQSPQLRQWKWNDLGLQFLLNSLSLWTVRHSILFQALTIPVLSPAEYISHMANFVFHFAASVSASTPAPAPAEVKPAEPEVPQLTKKGKKKKTVSWPEEGQLREYFYFELDETERGTWNI